MGPPEPAEIPALLQHLSIEVDQVTEFGPVETIRVRLLYDREVISESSCGLPEKED